MKNKKILITVQNLLIKTQIFLEKMMREKRSLIKIKILIIKEWLKIRPNWKNNNYVFTNIKGSTRPGKVRPLNQKYYNQLFNKLAEMTGVKMKDGSNPHPHTLRHSRAMEIYDNIDNLEILKKLLGHKNIATTQIYAQVRDSKVAEVQNTIVGGLISI